MDTNNTKRRLKTTEGWMYHKPAINPNTIPLIGETAEQDIVEHFITWHRLNPNNPQHN